MKTIKLLTAGILLSGIVTVKAQNTFPTPSGNVGIGTTTPTGILDINSGNTGSIPVFRGNGGYIPTGLRFVDDSYTQAGQIKEWAIWKGNTWAKGLAFMRYDAVNRCNGGICDVSLFLADNGNVGIGNNTPDNLLSVQGNHINSVFSLKSLGNGTPSTEADLTLWASEPLVTYSGVGIGNNIQHYNPNNGGFFKLKNPARGGSYMRLLDNQINFAVLSQSGNTNDAMVITGNGNVGIGSLNPDEKLTVKGNIHAEEVRVDLQVPADYVFEKYYNGVSTLKSDYTMPTLAEVEKFTKENNHLPNIPSAKEIQEKGLQVGEMTNLLLQKIEELTLYTIEQQKRIEALEAKLADKK